MKVLSLFDGMGCLALALQKAGIQIDSYDAYEIDEYAIKTVKHNFPFANERGDVFKADFTKYLGVDIIGGGSPCTYWSIAQKNNRETTASGLGWELFQQYVRAIKEAQPRYFVYENNKSMSNAIRDSISETFGFEPILINSALVSAQNRQRLYWVGKRNADGTYSKVGIEQPKDKGILLKDILETVVTEKAYTLHHTCNYKVSEGGTKRIGYVGDYEGQNSRIFSPEHKSAVVRSVGTEKVAVPVGETTDNKAFCITANYDGAYIGHTLKRHARSLVGERIPKYSQEDKARPLNAYYSNNCGGIEHRIFSDNPNKQQVDVISEPVRVGDIGSTSQAQRVYSSNGKSVNITSNAGGQGARTGLYLCPADSDKIYPIYEVKDGVITHNGKEYPINLADGFYIIRKLTVRECMRLQTVPEWYKFPVSNTQAYKMLGNGWTVDVIAHILKGVKGND